MSRRLRACLIQTRLGLGGPVWVTLALAKGLSQKGWDTQIIGGSTKRSEISLDHLPVEMGIYYKKFKSLSPYVLPHADVISLFQIWRFLRNWRPDVVHTHSTKAGWVGRLAAHLAGVPVIIHTYHGHALDGYKQGLANRAFFTIERALSPLTDGYITLSRSQLEDFCHECRVAPEKKFHIVPLGLDTGRLRLIDPFYDKFRSAIGVSESALLVGIIARLTPDKNVSLFLDAVAQIVQKGFETARFVIVGDGPLRAKLEHQAKKLGLEGKVIFAGYQMDMSTVYSDLDVVALTSLNDGTPLTLLEAMAFGKPVVATAVGGVKDCVPPNCGILVPSGDVQAVADAISKLLADPDLMGKYGENGKNLIRTERSIDLMVERHDRLFKEILASKSKIALEHPC